MLDRIKDHLFTLYNPEEKKGVFLSCFDESKKLLVSSGSVETEKPLRELVEEIYTKQVAPWLEKVSYVVIDVVTEVVSFADAQQALALDPNIYGIVVEDLEDDTVWVMLPHVVGATDMKQVLYDIKKKYAIHGKAAISWFTTERIVITK